MKPNIHPQYHTDTQVVCSCGNVFTTGSTKKNITVEVCYKCHPFFTGEHRFVDLKGRVDSFQKKQEIAKQYRLTMTTKRQKKENREEKRPKTLRELLGEA